MNKKWYMFKLFGHPVYMTPSFLIVMLVFSLVGVNSLDQLIQGLFWIPILFFGILLHELGHATASKAFGYGHSELLFWGLGGLAINNHRRRLEPLKQVVISLAGPLASFLVGVASGAAWYAAEGGFTTTSLLGSFLALMTSVNLFWAVFNLLPIHPMDGGQALLNGLRAFVKPSSKAIKYTAYISLAAIVLSVGAYAAYFGRAPGLMILFLAAYFGYMNWKMLQQGQELSIMG